MKPRRTKDGREKKGGRKGGRKEEEERVYSTRGIRQAVNIHKVSEGLRLNACGRRVRGKEQALSFCMSASGCLHCGAQHAKRPTARKQKITQVMME